MRQTASILLLFILAFNWVGYRLFTGFLEHHSDISLEKKIDSSAYSDAELIEMRVPLNAPYLSSNPTEFERFDGEIELQGKHFKYVKRKIENGQLVLLCLPDENKNRIQNSREEFFKLVNDLSHSTQHKNKDVTTTKSFTTEYKKENNLWVVDALPLTYLTHTAAYLSDIATGYGSLPEHPPKA